MGKSGISLSLRVSTLGAVAICAACVGCAPTSLQSKQSAVLQKDGEFPAELAEAMSAALALDPTGWSRQMGFFTVGTSASKNETVGDLAVDSKGNSYLAITTSGGLGEESAGSTDIAVAKYSASGELLWVRQFGKQTGGPGAVGADEATGIAVDAQGNAYVVGQVSGAVGEVQSAPSTDILVAKFSPFGTISWVKQLGSVTIGSGSSVNDYSGDISVDSAGGVLVSGATAGNLADSMGNGGVTGSDAFFFKLSASGSMIWKKQLGKAASNIAFTESETIRRHVSHPDGGIVFCGYTTGNVADTNPGPVSTEDVFVFKTDASGATKWTNQLGSYRFGSLAVGRQSCRGITVDADGNSYVSLESKGSASETVGGSTDVFLAKIDSVGQLLWLKSLGTADEEYAGPLAMDASGNILMTGWTTGSLGEANLSPGIPDLFVAKWSQDGQHISTKQFGGVTGGQYSNGGDYPYGLVVAPGGMVYLAGSTSGHLFEQFAGGGDAFLTRFAP